MAALYLRSVVHIRWLLDAVERWLETVPDGAPVKAAQVRAQSRVHAATDDEAAVAVAALVDIGILRPGEPPCLSRQMLRESAGYRRGVREAIEAVPAVEPAPLLCATLPPTLDAAAALALRYEAIDLRATLLDLVASAQKRIVLAAPFWDTATARELAELLVRRLAAGVSVDLLGRFEGSAGDASPVLATLCPGARVFRWYDQDPADSSQAQTFHFKAAIVDDGQRAYLGSANMTAGGLRSRLELGIVLEGRSAVSLARILDVVLGLATRVHSL